MTRCDNCDAALACPSARSAYAHQCEAFKGPTVRPALDATDAAFWRVVADDAQAAADWKEDRETAFAASRGVL